MPSPSTSEPPPLEGLVDPQYEIAPWPDGFTEDAFRDHLDRLHARHMGDTIEAPKRDRLRSWRDRYLREAIDADRMAARLTFLCELAHGAAIASKTGERDELVRTLIVEAKRGVPRVHTTDCPRYEDERPMSANPQSITVSHPWLNPHLAETSVSTVSAEPPPRCA